MGLFSFVKDAGEKVLGSLIGTASAEDQGAKLQQHLQQLGLPDADKVKVSVENGKATVTGDGVNQANKEKILVAVGNVAGISGVDDKVNTTAGSPASNFYTVKSGDTLSAIAKSQYGDANAYMKIFEANKPMLSSPDKIYPGQTLIIPPK